MYKILFLFLVFFINVNAQDNKKFNLSFEKNTDPEIFSDGWAQGGEYTLSVDSMAFEGNKSGKIVSNNNHQSFGRVSYKIPAKYQGKSIKLEGYIKVKGVSNGYAGLLLRADGENGVLGYADMKSEQLNGTKDWQKYGITLDYPIEAKNIHVAGMLVGEGTAWFDNFTLTIDGQDVQILKTIEKKPFKAELDTEFDQGSKISIKTINKKKIKNLDLFARVWGFLKYHHPAIAKGDYHWDYELFRVLPDYITINNNKQRDVFLVKWIESLGPLQPCPTCENNNSEAFIQPDFKWIRSSSKILKKALMNIYNRRSQGPHYYIGMVPDVFNPIFKHENAYENMSYPDQGFRLLALFRYWNMIHYFSPYKHLMDKDWNSALHKYIPQFLQAEDELAYELVLLRLIAEVQDTHANLVKGTDKIEQWKGIKYSNIKTRFIENQLVVTGHHQLKSGESQTLSIGDTITHINGKSVKKLIEQKSPYYSASNKITQLRNMAMDLLRSNEDFIDIKYRSGQSSSQNMQIKTYLGSEIIFDSWYRISDKKSHQMLDDNIAYVYLGSINAQDVEEIKKLYKDTQAIIIDIRNYPSAFVVFSLGGYFVNKPTSFVKFSKGKVNNPGEFNFTDDYTLANNGDSYQGKLVVLINEITQSQAEYTSMAFRAGQNTTVIGSTTAGADGNVSKINLPGGLMTSVSGICD